MDAFDEIKKIGMSQVLSALGIKFLKQGKQLHLFEGEKLTDGWKADEETGFVKDFAGKRAEGDRVTFVKNHLGLASKSQVVDWYKTAFGIETGEAKQQQDPITQLRKMKTETPEQKGMREKIFDKWSSLPNLNEEQRAYVSSRGIDPDSISDYAKDNRGMIAVAIFDEDGFLTIQNRSIHEKKFVIEPGTLSKGCFMSHIDTTVRKVYVVEGMFDFLTIAQFRVNVLGMKSAMDGASLVRAFSSKGYEVTIIPDNDDAGRNMHASFDDMPHFWVDLSKMEINPGEVCKDTNEFLLKSGYGIGEGYSNPMLEHFEANRMIAGPVPPKRPYEIIDYASSLEDGIDELRSTKIENVMSWGVRELDERLGYLMPGQLILVGGLTGSGKSTLVNEITGNVSKQGIKVGRFVLEDRHQDKRKEDLYYEIGRIRRARGEKNYPKNEFMANNVYDKIAFSKDISDARSALASRFANIMDIKANTQERMKIDELGSLVQDFVTKGCKLIVIDHLHYFKIVGDAQRYDLLIENAMQYINAIARDYSVTIMLVAHYKKLGGSRPDDESFKDAISISQVPNKVVHVHRDKMAHEKGFTELIVTKNREGWTGTIEMNFDTETNSYSNVKSELQVKREKDSGLKSFL